jgi:hypothetical protein
LLIDLSSREKRLSNRETGSVAEGASKQSLAIAHKIYKSRREGGGRERGRKVRARLRRKLPFESREMKQRHHSIWSLVAQVVASNRLSEVDEVTKVSR